MLLSTFCMNFLSSALLFVALNVDEIISAASIDPWSTMYGGVDDGPRIPALNPQLNGGGGGGGDERHYMINNDVMLHSDRDGYTPDAGEGQDSSAVDSEAEDNRKEAERKAKRRYPVFSCEFVRIETPFIIALWIFCASLAKIGFHMSPGLSKIFPESCLLIAVGVAIGLFLFVTSSLHISPLTPDTFFLYMLPPIILDAGYFMPNRLFFDHIGTIMLFAVVGTIFNTLTIGGSLWAAGKLGWFGFDTPLLEMFLFSALISAVDPVAVLAVFEEIHVNEILYIVVFGESLLNDAVTVVLYHMFEAYADMGVDNLIYTDLLAGVASFFVVAIGGTVIGVFWGFCTGFVTKFTNEVRVIEPIFIFVMAYMAYLNAEMFHMSGILAITFCGITMKNYVEANISHKSHTTVKYAMKMLSSSSETVIFMFLGVATVSDSHHWNTPFVVLTITFCSVYRAFGVVLLTSAINHFRLYKLNRVDKFVMSYGGLRGAVAFALVLLINPKRVKLQPIFVTTTIAVIYFTVFIQGITIKPLVKVLNVKRAKKRKPTMNERIHERIMDHMMAGIEDILGRHGDHHVRDRFKRFDNQFIRPYLLRNHQGAEPKILETYSKLAMKDAMDYMRKIPSTIGNISGTESMSAIFRNYTSGNLNSSSSYPQLDASTWNIDLQELEYNPSKKDLTDAKIHHLLSEELVQPHRRHRRLSYSRHAVDDRDLSTQPVNYRMHMNIRRVMGDQRKHHHKRSKRLKDGKQNHVSFPGIQQNGSAKQFTHDYIDEVLQEAEGNEENSKDEWENGITFTANPSHELPFELNSAAKKLAREFTNGPSGGDSSRVTTPTALEKMLPWKRGDNVGEVDTGPLKQNEFPAWCSNKEYLAYSSPSATFLGLFRRESSTGHNSQSSLNQDGSAPNSPSSVLLIEEGGNSAAILISPNKNRRVITPRRGSMMELSPDTIPEEELLTVSGGGSTASLSERWSLRPVSRASQIRQLSLPSTLNTSSFDTSSSTEEEEEEEKEPKLED